MTSVSGATHDRELFAGTATYYARYRPAYPVELIDAIAAEFGLGPAADALDLGCGTGQIALPLSRTGCVVWAMDPDPDMIGEAVRAQADGDYGTIRWVLGRGEDLPTAGLPPLRVVTMGASFHWMDRDLVLATLDKLIVADGGVVLMSGAASIFSQSNSVEGAWLEVAREVVRQFLGPERRAGTGTYSHPRRGHEEVLRDSPFSQVTRREQRSTRMMSIDDIVGLQLSTSYASPARLGDQASAFLAELSRRLRELGEEFETIERTEMIVARRPPAERDRQ
jgi:SAM-dependent methyltransferase